MITKDLILSYGFKPLIYGEYKKGDIILDFEYTDKGVYNFIFSDDLYSEDFIEEINTAKQLKKLMNIYDK